MHTYVSIKLPLNIPDLGGEECKAYLFLNGFGDIICYCCYSVCSFTTVENRFNKLGFLNVLTIHCGFHIVLWFVKCFKSRERQDINMQMNTSSSRQYVSYLSEGRARILKRQAVGCTDTLNFVLKNKARTFVKVH